MELLDVLDEEGNLIGKKEDKDSIHEKGLWHREVCALIRNEKGEYLIQKRAATKKQAPNKWGMTAGHVDAGENFDEAIVREIKEELGIEVSIEELSELKYITLEEMDQAVKTKDETCSYAQRDQIMKKVIKILKEEIL